MVHVYGHTEESLYHNIIISNIMDILKVIKPLFPGNFSRVHGQEIQRPLY